MKATDEDHLRLAFAVAERAQERGNHPFGAILVGPDGEVLLEAENGYLPDGDMTAHAERLLATAASKAFEPEELFECTLYSSAEPCAMCAGAIYWSGIARVVYALGEDGLRDIVAEQEGVPTMALPCREVFARGGRTVTVAGPADLPEATTLHDGFWG